MRLELRPYQQDAFPLLRQSMINHQRLIYVLPTGGGKTVIFSELIRLAVVRSSKTLTITDRVELFKQTFKSISSTAQSPQEINAQSKIFDNRALCTVAMVETLARRMKKGLLGEYVPDLIIIDECHKGNFNKIIDSFPNTRVIGFTATPIGKHLIKYYTDVVQHIDIHELIEQHYLLPCRAFQMQDDLSDVKVVAGEFQDKSLYNHFNTKKLYSGVIDKYKEKLMGVKTLIFNCNIKHAENMTREFNEAGIRSECVTSKTPVEERERILKAFSDGKFLVLQNCSILTTGYDEVSIGAVIVNRATMSLALWIQMQGRGARTYNGLTHFTVLDFGMNHDRHGLWSEPRIWKLEAPKRRKKKDVAPVKECPQCSAMLAASARMCQYCGYEFPIKTTEEREGILVEIKSGAPVATVGHHVSELGIEDLIKLQKVKKYKASFVWRLIRSRGQDAILEYAHLIGYHNGWVNRQIEQLEQETAPTSSNPSGSVVEFNDYIVS